MSPSRSGCLPARRCRFPGLIRSTFLALPLSLLVLVAPSVAQEPDQDVPVTAVGGPVHADLFTGAATTSIPIDVPPGRGGVQPNLALVYTSASRNGWVGLGWKLDKGVIDRQTKFGLNYSGDDYIFRLAGINVELVNTGTDEYRAKVEGRFTRVQKKTASDSKPYFLATDKTGTKFYFGQAATTRVAHPTDATKIFRWCLDRVEDPHGNYMTLSYTRHQGQAYLARIDYTGHGRTAPTNRVLFHLEDRTDAVPLYTTNFLMKTAKRLKTIEVKANNRLVRAYKLTYTSSAGTSRSLLSSVQTYGSNATVATNGAVTGGTSLPAVQMSYTGAASAGAWQVASGYTPPATIVNASGQDQGLRLVDLNGDGRMDVVWNRNGTSKGARLSTGTGWVNAAAFTPPVAIVYANGQRGALQFVDLNRDGRMDGIWRQTEDSKGARLSTGTGWRNVSAFAPPASNVPAVDLNGDGRKDLVWYTTITGNEGSLHTSKGAYLNTGAGWQDVLAFTPPVTVNASGQDQGVRFVDLNGDGRMDVVWNRNGTSQGAHLSTGTGWVNTAAFAPPVAIVNASGQDQGVRFVDLNGDGRMDVVWNRNGTSQGARLSTGTGWVNAAAFAPPVAIVNASGQDQGVRFVDLNGDGRMDVVWNRNGTSQGARLSTGAGWVNAAAFAPPVAIVNASGQDQGIRFVDLNGDGRMDVVWNRNGTSQGARLNTNTPLLLTSLTNGLGATTTIAYTPSTNYSNTQLPSPVQTVSAITTNDGNGNVATTTYTYSGGYRHLGEREFRGFNYVKVTGPAGASGERTITETWFHQGNDTAVYVNNPNVVDGYLQGAPYRTKVTDAAGRVYAETTTSYTRDADGRAPFFTPPASVVTKICDGNTCGKTTRTDYTYDAYGNVTQEVQRGDTSTTTDDRTVVRAYSPNTTKWIVSLPTRERLHAGESATGTKLAQTDLYYDGTTTCTVASTNQQPTHGNLTRTVRWRSGATTSPETRRAYDVKGNRLCSRDANGHTTTLAYDPSGTFVTTRTNPKRQVTTIAYYGVNRVATTHGLYGQVKSVTDANGAVVTTQYDALGRRTKVTQPDGFWTTTSYVRFGTVGSQHVRTNSQLGLSTWTYFDGLGRPIKTERTGPENKKTVTRTEYDKRGAVTRTGVLADVTIPIIAPPPGQQLALEAPTVTVVEGGTASIRVRLTAAPTGTVTVTASESNPDISLAPASRRFTTANWNTYQTFTVTGQQDADTVTDSATVTISASGGGVSASASVPVTITDDDSPTPTPTPAISGTGVRNDPYVIPPSLLNTDIDCTRLPNWRNLTNSGAFFRFTVPTTGTWTATFTFAPSPKRVAFDGAFDTSSSTAVASPMTATASLTAAATANFDVDPYVFTLGTLTSATLRLGVPTSTPTPTPAISGTGVRNDPYVIPPSLLNADIDCTRLPNWRNLTNSGAFFRFTVPTTGTWRATFTFAPSPKRVAFDGAFDTSSSTAVASPMTATASLTAGATANFDVDPYVFTLGTLTSATLRLGVPTSTPTPTPAISGTGVRNDPYVIPPSLLNADIDCTRLPNWRNLTNSGAFFRFTVPTTGTWRATFTFAPSPKRVAFDGAFDTSSSTAVASPMTATASLTAGATANFDVDPYVFTLGTLTSATLRLGVPTSTPTPTPAISGTGVRNDPYVIPPSLLNADIDCTRLPNWRNLTNSGAFFRFTVPTTGTWRATFTFAPSPKRVAFDGAFDTSSSTAVASPMTATASLTAGATANFDVDPYVFTLGTLTRATLRLEASTQAPGPPGPPTNVSRSSSIDQNGDQTVTVSWEAPTSGGTPTTYRAQFYDSYSSFWVGTTITTGTSAGQFYSTQGILITRVRVRAENGHGNSAYVEDTVTSILQAELALEAPTVTVAEGGTASIRVRLTAQPTGTVTVTTSESDPDISLSPSSRSFTTSNWNTYQTVTVTGLQDSGMTNDTATVTLTASGGGVSDTTTVSVTITDDDVVQAPGIPGTPTLVSLTATSLTLQSTVPTTGGAPSTYRWRYSTNSTVSNSDPQVTSSGPTVTISNLTANRNYWVDVRAENSAGQSNYSSDLQTSTASTTPSPATSVTANAGSDKTVASGGTTTLSGSASVTNGSGSTTYSWSKVSGTGGSLSSSTVAQPTFTAPTVTANRSITYRLTATNNGVSDTDDVVITVQAPQTVPIGVPGPPRNVSAARNYPTVSIGWGAPDTGGTPDLYRIEVYFYSDDGLGEIYEEWLSWTTVSHSTTSYSFNDVSFAYSRVRVRTENSHGNSDWVETNIN